MSWLYSRALVEAFSAGTCSAGGVSVPWSMSPMPPVFCSHGKMTGFSRLSRFGMTCEPLTDAHGEGLLTWFREVSRARTSARRAREQGSMGSEAACGKRWPGSLARWDRDSCSWRTHQFPLLGGLELFSETWPRWGMMRGGECWGRTMPELRTSGTGSGLWPTIRKSDGEKGGRGDLIQAVRGNENTHFKMPMWATPCKTDAKPITGGNLYQTQSGTVRHMRPDGKSSNRGLATQVMWPSPTKDDANNVTRKSGEFQSLTRSVQMFPTPTTQDASNNGGPSQMERNSLPLNAVAGGALNPMWVEWLMGWPLGWTDLRPLEMDRFRQWCASHGRRWPEGETLRRGAPETGRHAEA